MKHHCHCHLHEQISKFKAGKLGLFGGILIIGHLLFHVAECLVLPAFLMAIHGNSAEATELDEEDMIELVVAKDITVDYDFKLSLSESLQKYTLQTPSGDGLYANLLVSSQ